MPVFSERECETNWVLVHLTERRAIAFTNLRNASYACYKRLKVRAKGKKQLL